MNILFVCTGNTCRSPMAAVIMESLAIESNLDILIESAGLFAANGENASVEAIEAVKKYGLDLKNHKSQQITPELIEKSDLIIAMTEGHKMLLSQMAPEKTCTVCELADLEGDIEDPYGGDLEDYERVCDSLYIALTQIADKLLEIQENQEETKN